MSDAGVIALSTELFRSAYPSTSTVDLCILLIIRVCVHGNLVCAGQLWHETCPIVKAWDCAIFLAIVLYLVPCVLK